MKYYKTIELLIKYGININEKSRYGFTALMYACRWLKDYKIIELLINSGANINEKDILLCSKTCNIKIITLLMRFIDRKCIVNNKKLISYLIKYHKIDFFYLIIDINIKTFTCTVMMENIIK